MERQNSCVSGSSHFSLESLEGRVLLSVGVDSAGWTVVTPSDDSRIIYVSASQGSDSNSGFSTAAPVKTLKYATSLMRANKPDHLLLKRGDTWHGESFDSWTGGGGRSAKEPKVIGTYGSGARPKLLTQGLAGWSQRKNIVINHLVLTGINFQGNRTNTGYDRVAPGTNMLIEDCVFTNFGTGSAIVHYYTGTTISNIRFRRDIIADNFNPNVWHNQGMYFDGTQGVVIEESVIYKNGWLAADRSDATMQNHGIYFSAANDGAIVRRNIIADASSHGLQMRGGGTVQDNLFIHNPIGMSFGMVNGANIKPGGVSGEISGNVVLEPNDIKPADGGSTSLMRGWAIELANTGGSGTYLRGNIFAHDTSLGTYAAIQLEVPQGPNNPQDSSGLRDLTIDSNIVYNWERAVNIDPEYTLGGSGYKAINNLRIRNNQFTKTQYDSLVYHPQALNPSVEKWERNRYYDDRSRSQWFRVQGSSMNFADWRDKVEPTARAGQVNYPDPYRSVASYNAALGGTASYDAFIQRVLGQGRSNWDPRLNTPAIVDYIRRGFGMGMMGDADLDGVVAAGDYSRINAAFATYADTVHANEVAGWENGDLNLDGRVTSDDYFLMDSAYAQQPTTLGAIAAPQPLGAPVPMAAPVPGLPSNDDLFGPVLEGVL